MRVVRGGVLAVVVAVVVAALAALAPTSALASAAATVDPDAPKVVVIAVPDLRWDDLSASATPALWSLLASGAAGAAAVKSTYQRAGCADGLLTLGAGDRVAAEPGAAPPAPCTGLTPAQVEELTRRAQDIPAAQALATALRDHGRRTATLGDAARIALPGADVTAAAGSDIAAADGTDLALAVEDQIYRADASGRAAATRAVDTDVARLLDPLPLTSTVLLVGSSDGSPTATEHGPGDAHLHVALARGPGFGPGYLSSPSTQRAPYVELIDVAPTVLRLLGVPAPADLVGRAWEPAAGPAAPTPRASHLADLDVKAVQGARWRPLFMWSLAFAALAVVLLALLVADRGRGARRGVAAACTLVAALPAVSWLVQLVPWWRWNLALLPALLLLGAAAVAALATWAGRVTPARTLVVVTGVSALVLMADLVSGSRLQTSALLGDSPITAGRFYGAGNTAFGVLAASALLGAAVTCAARPDQSRRTAVGRAALAGVVVAVAAGIDAAPTLGADLGGALALMPSGLVLVLLLARVRLDWRRGLAAMAVGVVPLVILALWDYHRPAERRTHIGRFVAQVLDGEAGPVIGRKISANLGQLVGSPFLPLVLGTLLVVVLAWRSQRPRLARVAAQTPGLVPAVVAVTLCALLGGALNDSGVTVTGIMLAVALPAVTALAVRADPS